MSDIKAIPAQATPTPVIATPTPAAAPASPLVVTGLADQLAELRADIDRIDDGLHDLLMRRARVVERVAELGRVGKIPFRPGREAAMIRRLLGRHAGRLPPRAIARLWREMFAANIAIEARFVIATCDSDPGHQIVQAAREHFGALTPLRIVASPADAIAEVGAGRATAAVLPLPSEADAAPWWPELLPAEGQPRVRVVARLPFWAERAEGAATVEALAVAAAAADPSGDDRSLIAFRLPPHGSTTEIKAILAGMGFGDAGWLRHRESSGREHGLADVAGFVADDDPRLGRLPGAAVLGSYAVPVRATPA